MGKKCRICKKPDKEWEKVYSTTQTTCSPACALIYGREQRAKEKRKRNIEAKKRLKTKSQWLKDAQALFNRYIRLRDEKEPCISCQRHHAGQYHAGHYRTVGGSPELRFEELNCHKQCAPCNNHLSGNIANYRINLVKKVGDEKVGWIEGPHEAKKYSIDDIKEIIQKYKAKIKELE